MIIARAPLRVTFVGGGTDMKSFFHQESGAVINAAINKYVYITVNKKFDSGIRLKYSRTETVNSVKEINHPLFREALKHLNITDNIEITSHADIPSSGSGLGSSSTFLVCLLHALYAYKGIYVTPEKLAQDASKIERDILQEHGGYQDQYIAAYGNFRYMEFHPPNAVSVSSLVFAQNSLKELESKLMLFYTGIPRKSHDIQQDTASRAAININLLRSVKWQANRLKDELQRGNHEAIGTILDEYWNIKKQLSNKISSKKIDEYYSLAKEAGAVGGKILGAGGGGFMLFYVPEEKQGAVRIALNELQELPFSFEREGSKILYVADNFLPGEIESADGQGETHD